MVDNDKLMNGFVIRRRNGEAGSNPLVRAASRAATEMLRFASEFGMTPVARARIAAGVLGENPLPKSKFGNLLA
jgi:phage terminase small subunit